MNSTIEYPRPLVAVGLAACLLGGNATSTEVGRYVRVDERGVRYTFHQGFGGAIRNTSHGSHAAVTTFLPPLTLEGFFEQLVSVQKSVDADIQRLMVARAWDLYDED
jgi:hypothetical protein